MVLQLSSPQITIIYFINIAHFSLQILGFLSYSFNPLNPLLFLQTKTNSPKFSCLALSLNRKYSLPYFHLQSMAPRHFHLLRLLQYHLFYFHSNFHYFVIILSSLSFIHLQLIFHRIYI